MTIRTRLTLWYAAIMFVSLLAMSALTYHEFAPDPVPVPPDVATEHAGESDETDLKEMLRILFWCGVPPALPLGPRSAPLSRVVVKDGVTVTVLPVGKIDYVKAEDDYVLLFSGGRNHIKKQTLASLEDALPREQFVRIHRSYLLAVDRLARVEGSGTGASTAVLTDGARLPVSRAGAQRLRALLRPD